MRARATLDFARGEQATGGGGILTDGEDETKRRSRDGATGKQAARRGRSAAALRENLRRRKKPGTKPASDPAPDPDDDGPAAD